MRRFTLLLAAGVAALACAGTAAAQHHDEPPVPWPIQVDEGHKVFLQAHAVGVQIYGCTATGWSLVAPRATLYDRHGKRIGSHFAGPTWQAKDGSSVKAQRVAGVPVAGTIDWLKLQATATTPGRFGRVSFIQRINTTGGVAPAASTCTADTVGDQREIPYTADYRFFKEFR